MQILEYYFNPKARGDRFFEIFSFEPENGSSKGNVYLVGELANALPQNSGLLKKFAKSVLREYSLTPASKSQDAFFRTLLKGANDFFAKELRKGNGDWLGNLHGALLYVKNSGKKSSIMFAKCGGIRVFMTRGTNVVDLAKTPQDSSHGAELFSSVVSLHAFAQDKIVILTKDVCDALHKENALSDLSVLSDAKQFQAFLRQRERMFSRLSGILFAVLMEEFVFKTPPLSFLKRSLFSIKLPKLQVPSFTLNDAIKQKMILVGALVLVVLGGFLVFQGERTKLAKQVQTIVLQIQVIQKEAQDALELSDQRSANILLQEAFKKASSHTSKEVPFRETFIVLQKELEHQLLAINSIQYVENPPVLVDIKKENSDLIPQNMLLAQGNIYLFNPFSSQIFVFDLQKEKGKTVSDLSIRKPDVHTAEFNKNVYTLNPQEGTIAKNEDPWMSEESLKKPVDAKSMTIDGNIWILTQDNTLQRYFGGLWQEDVHPLVFPLLKNASMIKAFPGLPYLYILDPSESRVVLFTKSGDLVKQYRVGVQAPLLDFTVSPNGNTLYLLAGSRVLAIEQE